MILRQYRAKTRPRQILRIIYPIFNKSYERNRKNMKSRIIPTLPEAVLSYNITGEKEQALERALPPGMKHIKIPPDKAGETLGFLAGYNGFPEKGTSETADGECAVFSGINGKRLDELLKAMRREKLDIPLKAVMTAHNQKMTVTRLLEELKKEDAAVHG